MAREASPENTFVVGLAIAGAVSAGAYSAGVLDTLFRALASHEARFQRGEVDHRVVLKAMSGASAGGICSALSAVSLIDGVVPALDDEIGLPMLHDLWVNRIRLTPKAQDETESLLGDTDIEDRIPAASLLDSQHLNRQAQALTADVRVPAQRPALSFVADELDVFITTTNLMGVPYRVRFGGRGDAGHSMSSHSIVTHFRMLGLGTTPVASHWLRSWKADGITLDVRSDGTERALDFAGDTVWKTLLDTAVASAAFPIGLAARRLSPSLHWIENQAWPVDADPAMRPIPRLRTRLTSIPYIAVDGGVSNNEPFELARFAIRKPLNENGDKPWQLDRNAREPEEADRAVIMIDPFPEEQELVLASDDPHERGREKSLLFVLKSLLPALISHARFKPVELMNAVDTDIHSRFLIGPSRTAPQGAKLTGGSAIASGFLGGFGGFFSRKFRQHDYELGQRNCRSFLENYFVLSGRNKIFARREGLATSKERIDANDDKPMVRIIQFDARDLPAFDAPLPFPALKDAELREAIDRGGRRGERVASQLIWELELPGILKLLIYLVWRGSFLKEGLKTRFGRKARGTLMADLAARQQLETAADLSDEDRALYVGLLRHAGKPASIADIAKHSTIVMSSGTTAPALEPFGALLGQDSTLYNLTPAEAEKRLKADTIGVKRAWGTQDWTLARRDMGITPKPVQAPPQKEPSQKTPIQKESV